MTDSKNILVPVDFTSASLKALEAAIYFQKQIGGKIIVLHVAKNKNDFGAINERLAAILTDAKLQAEDYLTSIETGSLSDVIISTQKKNNVGLIVMATNGVSTLSRKITGTNTSAVINKTTCAVLVIPEDTKLNSIKTVVLATDNHSSTLEHAAGALEFVKKLNANLLVMHINPTLDAIAEVDYQLSEVPNKIKKYIDYSNLEMHVSSNKDVRKGIESFAEKHHADLLIMITHHRSVFESLFVKSQTKQMVFYSNIPMLVIPSAS